MFFCADHHFGHAAIIALCARPFQDTREMDAEMVARWNAVVRPQDDVWHLGDVAYRSTPDEKARLFRRLHGRKRLVIGNHDDEATVRLPWAEAPTHFALIRAEGRRLALCHYGLRVWPGMHRGAINLYGHSHGRLPGHSAALDVGVDCWGYRPASLDEVVGRLRTLPPFVDPEVGRTSH